MVSVLEWSVFKPWPVTLCCALRQDTLLSGCLSSLRSVNLVPATLGATLPLTPILSGGGGRRNSPVGSAWWTTWKSQKTVFSRIFYTQK